MQTGLQESDTMNLHPERGLLWCKDKEQKEYLEERVLLCLTESGIHTYLFPQYN